MNTLAPGSSTLHEGVIALEQAPSEVSSVERERDLRLDFFRGIALFSIFLDHLPGNVLAQFTIQSFMFGDAAEVFILISGYTAGMVYGRCLERQGFLIAAVRVGHRVWQLYVAHVFVFMIFLATVAYTVGTLNSSLYAEEFLAADFLNEPGVAVIKALTLQFQPAYMDILPLYIVLLAAFPFVLAGFRSWPGVVLGASLALWVAVQLDARLALPAYPGPNRVWLFNPLGWQALFFIGAWLGWRGINHKLSWLDRGWFLGPAAGLALVGLVVRLSWTLHGLYHPIPALGHTKYLWLFLSKGDLGLLGFANVLAVAALVRRLISPQASFLAGPVAWPAVACGRHSLHIFCLGILLTVLGHLVLREFFGGFLMQLAVSVVGMAIMVAVAALMDWFATRAGTGGRVLRHAPTTSGRS
jgi:hypothetical protein